MHKLKTVADYYRFFQKNYELLGIKTATISTKMNNFSIEAGDVLPMEYNHKVQSCMFYSPSAPSVEIRDGFIRISHYPSYHITLLTDGEILFHVKHKTVDYLNLTEEERFQDSVDEGHYLVLDKLYETLQTLIQNNTEYFN